MRAWEELVGRPRMRVIRFQEIAPSRPASRTCWLMSSMRIMPLPMVLATAVPKTKAAMKFQKAAQATARKGVKTRVETTVAMELAASCQPLENSKARVRKMTTRRREKLVMDEARECVLRKDVPRSTGWLLVRDVHATIPRLRPGKRR